MSTDNFTITEHVISGCHIREYPGSTVNQEDVLQLHVKQYTPKNPPQPIPVDAITFIAAHGVSLPKESYEPLWDELLMQSTRNGFHIRSIWVADCASMNMSGVLNEDKLSMDCSWMDHPHDLLLMINQFRSQMSRPLVGIGYSFGGTIITNLAYLHPRLFTTLLLIDPVIQITPPAMGFGTDAPGVINYTLWRDDVWLSREAALHAHRRMLDGWDPWCIDRMARYYFRDLPTRLHPDVDTVKARFEATATPPTGSSPPTATTSPASTKPKPTPVTLTTTKHHDLLGQIRQNFSARSPATGRISISRLTHADMDPLAAFIPMYCPEPTSTFHRLPTLRPSCLWVLGGATYLKLDEMREGIKICGTGVGGSGGAVEGRAKEVALDGLGHLISFQDVEKVGEPCAVWLGEEMEKYRALERDWEEKRKGESHLVVGEE
ncbi:hypothetical protein BO71DRAFT_385251 [Aspergillus ellipticus CBS 707.79]|uniref:Uncharacterized protein n=1 Tax=Aspergillus ellipticus CBS 707.79 TaxID=1448320 RepID=A0A319DK02_9EURO|nr:hypothetical protein BO71DRAFT_385251 [Aspergillus ellipticus CBS 707.79]